MTDRQVAVDALAELASDASQALIGVTIGEHLRAQAERFGERPALVWTAPAGDGLERLSYRDLLSRAQARTRASNPGTAATARQPPAQRLAMA